MIKKPTIKEKLTGVDVAAGNDETLLTTECELLVELAKSGDFLPISNPYELRLLTAVVSAFFLRIESESDIVRDLASLDHPIKKFGLVSPSGVEGEAASPFVCCEFVNYKTTKRGMSILCRISTFR